VPASRSIHASTLSHLHCHIYTVTFTLSHLHCHIYSVTFTLSHLHCHIYTVTFTPSHLHCRIYTVTFTLSHLHCHIFTVTFRLSHLHCQRSWASIYTSLSIHVSTSDNTLFIKVLKVGRVNTTCLRDVVHDGEHSEVRRDKQLPTIRPNVSPSNPYINFFLLNQRLFFAVVLYI